MNDTRKVQVVPLGPVAVGTLLWRLAGTSNLTVCAKATLELMPGTDMQLVGPAPLRRDEQHELPSMCVLAPVDLLPQLRRPEITLSGRAHLRTAARRCSVRLAVGRGQQMLVDKTLEVIGDRRDGADPIPFEVMPVGYDRAYGGIGVADNPIGRGAGMSQGSQPNVIDPRAPERAAGFGPVPSAFALRKDRLAGVSAKSLCAEIVNIPDALDWEYFQVAPEDQQVDAFVGDEWLLLEHLDPSHADLRTRLPSIHAEARVFGQASALIPDRVPLRLESIHVEAEEGRCHLVWRGGFPLPDEEAALRGLIVVAGLGVAGEPIVWPRDASELTHMVQDQAEWLADDFLLEDSAGTITIVPRDSARPAAGLSATEPPVRVDRREQTMPFQVASQEDTNRTAPQQPAIPGAPWSSEPAVAIPAPLVGMATMAISVDEPHRPQGPSPSIPNAAPAAAAKSEEQRLAQERAAQQQLEGEHAAEERRRVEAERFEAEQLAAREAEAQRAAEEAKARKHAAKELKNRLYGRFKK